MSETYRKTWENTSSYDMYEERRMFVTPAMSQLVGGVVNEHFEQGDTVLEVGAGAGALRRYAGETADELVWIESEHYIDPLVMARRTNSIKVVAALPELPFGTDSLDGIISLGVLDTLSSGDLDGTATAAARALKQGGKIVHILDMSPDYLAEIRNSRNNGLFPLLFNGDDADHTLGIHYVALKNLARRVERLPVDPAIKNVFLATVTEPEKHMAKVNRTGILQLLGSIAKEHGMVVQTEQNWLGKLASTLATAFETAGLTIVQNQIVTTRSIVEEASLPTQVRGKGATDIVRKQGSVDVIKDSSALVLPGKVRVQADAQVLVAVNQ